MTQTTNTASYDCIVIGAGLTGLTTAFHLIKGGKRVLLIEEKDRIGGQIATHKSKGYTFESGPNTGAVSNPEVAELFQMLGSKCKMEVARASAKRRLILKGGKFHPLPTGPISAITTPLFTLKDKFRILGEPFRKKGTNPDESVGELTLRRLGKSFLDYAVDPFVSGIYAGDPMVLVTKYALPKLYALEYNHGSFIKGAIAKAKEIKTEREKSATKEVFSVTGGLENLLIALKDEIKEENILLECKSVNIEQDGKGWKVNFNKNGESFHIKTEYVVTTVPAYRLPEIIPFADKEKVNSIASLKYASLMQVSVGLKENPDPDFIAFGGLIPCKEKEDVLGILYPYQCFSGRAPKGKSLFSVFIGGLKKPYMLEKSDEEILELTKDILKRTMQYDEKFPLEHFKIFRHYKVIPQYDKDSGRRLAYIADLQEEYPHLTIAGNLKDGIGMADRIRQGTEIAKSILND